MELFGHAQNPLSLAASPAFFTSFYDQIFFPYADALGHWVFAKHRIGGRNRFELMACCSTSGFFSNRGRSPCALYQYSPKEWLKNHEDPHEF